jgi:hypothetical protein
VGLASLKKENIWITFLVLLSFCVAAYTANILVDYNYMFLMRGDGTPYDILYNLVDGNKVLYPVGVVALFLVYICAFYVVHFYATIRSYAASKKPVKKMARSFTIL